MSRSSSNDATTAGRPFHIVTWLDARLFRLPDPDRPPAGNTVSRVEPDEQWLRPPPRGGVLVFDGYCGFCTRTAQFVLRLDELKRVRALPLQGRDVLRVTGLTREEALREATWIGADGVRWTGAGAMAAALSAATGLPALLVYRIPPVRAAADRVYRWVAEHRRLLRGVTPYCEASLDADCDPDLGESCGCAVPAAAHASG